MRGAELCRRAGISYRQLDYWCRTGVLVGDNVVGRGSGTQRSFDRRHLVTCATLGAVSRLGGANGVLRRTGAAMLGRRDERYLVVEDDGPAYCVDDLGPLIAEGLVPSIIVDLHELLGRGSLPRALAAV